MYILLKNLMVRTKRSDLISRLGLTITHLFLVDNSVQCINTLENQMAIMDKEFLITLEENLDLF